MRELASHSTPFDPAEGIGSRQPPLGSPPPSPDSENRSPFRPMQGRQEREPHRLRSGAGEPSAMETATSAKRASRRQASLSFNARAGRLDHSFRGTASSDRRPVDATGFPRANRDSTGRVVRAAEIRAPVGGDRFESEPRKAATSDCSRPGPAGMTTIAALRQARRRSRTA